MKKCILQVLFYCILIITTGNSAIANSPETKVRIENVDGKNSKAATVMIQRLEVINKMDKSTLSSTEKKSLRKEVRSIHRQLRESGGGIYLSVGAVILILVLLIILL